MGQLGEKWDLKFNSSLNYQTLKYLNISKLRIKIHTMSHWYIILAVICVY